MKINNSFIIKAILYFLLSAVLTSIFIVQKTWLYSSVNAMILSGCIAGGKWLVQIVAALILLKEKKWEFIKRIGFVCFIGSVTLFFYYIFNFLPSPLGGFSQFVLAIALAILIMICLYYKVVQQTRLPGMWFWGWIFCLMIAISLQIKLVF